MDPSRAFLKDVKRVVVKVGTAVVTRPDGKLALGRLGSICEQVKALLEDCIEVIFVTSGAVGVGRQKLRHQRLMNSSFLDLQKPQIELDGKPCAAVGQSGLMALYDSLFSQDSTGIFWDNDSLAALLALELKADLLILLSDVEGLYTGPPSDPRSKLIHTYLKEKHDDMVTFGEKSRVGRGGMTAKVYAAWNAASAGIPVIISSGYTADSLQKVIRGDHVGTLFHKDAHLWVPVKETSARQMAIAARDASRRLQALSSSVRQKILLDVADALEKHQDLILVENEIDKRLALQSGTAKALIDRLSLKPGKIAHLAESLRRLALMKEPIGEVINKTEVAEGLILEKTTSSLGVILVVFESRPDALVQIASLAIRSGNGLLLKGGKEATHSNAILHKVITEALPKKVGGDLIGLVTSRDEIPDLLKLADVIDLVIPRGSNRLVSEIKESTKIPVLGHADGVCHVYVDKAADIEKASRIVLDSKVDYPAACNAMETLLVHKDLVHGEGLQKLTFALQSAGVILYGGAKVAEVLKTPKAAQFHHEYSSLACTVEIVDDVHAAIEHIHEHGSGHTDCIVTEDQETANLFLNHVDSAAVFHNASTRFCDGARFGLGAEVGISTSRIHARGPVGVEGLLTTRWLLRGTGQVVDGDRGVLYLHKDLPVESEPFVRNSVNAIMDVPIITNGEVSQASVHNVSLTKIPISNNTNGCVFSNVVASPT
ncbi:hypothetical protein O6H91_16G009400 [Diphasiastrum complanatum]|uniref:Uncharacterized protein n=1 Tax=Diphasiastrum complanatum TaxID=34168 RepID=A0ACC2B9U3_DIPCM|nr:hypothetical protein O6H91_16G009400 [Diphasiastrum complanatum]